MEHTVVTFSSYCCLGFFCLISGSTMQDCVTHIFLMIDMVLLEKGILMMGTGEAVDDQEETGWKIGNTSMATFLDSQSISHLFAAALGSGTQLFTL